MCDVRAPIVIALSTLRGFARDRIFHASLIFSVLFTCFAYLLSGLTIVENQKILVDFGLSAISMSGIIMAMVIGIASVGKEIENKTIYTVLSKPISRLEYILGKYLGCALAVIVSHLIISMSLVAILYAVGGGYPTGLALCFYLMMLESLLILATAIYLSVSVSSNFLASSITIAIFLIGRSAGSFKLIANRSESALARNFLRVFYDVFPNLDRFNIRELVAYSKPHAPHIGEWSTLYFFAYCLFFIAITSISFSKKDLS